MSNPPSLLPSALFLRTYHEGAESVVSLILTVDISLRCEASFRPRPLYLRGKTTQYHSKRGWVVPTASLWRCTAYANTACVCLYKCGIIISDVFLFSHGIMYISADYV